MNRIKEMIEKGKNSLGIELGSTRIKAVLIGEDFRPLASGNHDWQNKLENGIWTYDLENVWEGIRDAFSNLSAQLQSKYGATLTNIGSIGISAMMHGYLVFDDAGNQLTAFRTWRNTMTEEAALFLTEQFGFNIPQRWSIAHLYQAIINGEDHVKNISYMTTLAGYVHWKLTGQKLMGVGEASGMFPIDSSICNYNEKMLNTMNGLLTKNDISWKIQDVIPKVCKAGEEAGKLTEEGARLLDRSGNLKAGIAFCPPEGDAGTGMVATNSVAERRGNVSAGTSIFAMVVLEKELSKVYPEIDMVTTPAGRPVAMVHCNNCSTDLDAWVKLFGETLQAFGAATDSDTLYSTLYNKALEGDDDAGSLLSYNYYSGEHIVHLKEGRPMTLRLPSSNFTLANFMRSLLFSSMASLKIGMDILIGEENVRLDQLLGHGGIFKTPGVAQSLMASALDVSVVVMESAGEGGAWGIALLAAYMTNKTNGESLEAFLERVFVDAEGSRLSPESKAREGFARYMERYREGLEIERAAIQCFKE